MAFFHENSQRLFYYNNINIKKENSQRLKAIN